MPTFEQRPATADIHLGPKTSAFGSDTDQSIRVALATYEEKGHRCPLLRLRPALPLQPTLQAMYGIRSEPQGRNARIANQYDAVEQIGPPISVI